ncbi:MAG: VanZ family protein [Gallionella sp.]|nr:VanZ family protein [Gallionella sp.]MDD4947667.1 VanZ family protein [Gallionella sp.]MDD5612244.1 VanZ family protein [Gallionella sp.]
MEELFITETRARLRTLLAVGYALFIVYVSLSPFSGWREQGLEFGDVLLSPWSLTFTSFDSIVNLLAYIPFGLLVGLALRARFSPGVSMLVGMACGLSLSMGMEYLQMYLPQRNSSNVDILTNGAGMLLGLLLAMRLTAWPWMFVRLLRWRSRAFRHGVEMDFGLALLVLWVFGQINPSLPMLGNVFITDALHQPFVPAAHDLFDWWESLAVMLNLLMPGVLLVTVLRVRQHILTGLLLALVLVASAKFIAAAFLLKSWALLLWVNSEAMLGMLLGMLSLRGVQYASRKELIRFGATVTIAYLLIVNFVVDSNTPAAAMSVYHWHYGHLLNYNGLAQTITIVFPVLLLFHLWRIRHV